jgi:hypothetical protein
METPISPRNMRISPRNIIYIYNHQYVSWLRVKILIPLYCKIAWIYGCSSPRYMVIYRVFFDASPFHDFPLGISWWVIHIVGMERPFG